MIGNREFDTDGSCHVMGILNVTPDSFSDGGRYIDTEAAVERAGIMALEGAEIIDVGGESTRPGFEAVPADEEAERVVPVIEQIVKAVDIPVSVDTYKSYVAEEALKAGAVMVNDVGGFLADVKMAEVAARFDAACCLMQGFGSEPVPNEGKDDFLARVMRDLERSVDAAKAAGVRDERIMLDPGVGFGKTTEQNLMLMGRGDMIGRLGYPVLLGASRKSVIGNVLGLPADRRVEGTVASTVVALMRGYSFVRVHDVKENVRAIRMAEEILKG